MRRLSISESNAPAPLSKTDSFRDAVRSIRRTLRGGESGSDSDSSRPVTPTGRQNSVSQRRMSRRASVSDAIVSFMRKEARKNNRLNRVRERAKDSDDDKKKEKTVITPKSENLRQVAIPEFLTVKEISMWGPGHVSTWIKSLSEDKLVQISGDIAFRARMSGLLLLTSTIDSLKEEYEINSPEPREVIFNALGLVYRNSFFKEASEFDGGALARTSVANIRQYLGTLGITSAQLHRVDIYALLDTHSEDIRAKVPSKAKARTPLHLSKSEESKLQFAIVGPKIDEVVKEYTNDVEKKKEAEAKARNGKRGQPRKVIRRSDTPHYLEPVDRKSPRVPYDEIPKPNFYSPRNKGIIRRKEVLGESEPPVSHRDESKFLLACTTPDRYHRFGEWSPAKHESELREIIHDHGHRCDSPHFPSASSMDVSTSPRGKGVSSFEGLSGFKHPSTVTIGSPRPPDSAPPSPGEVYRMIRSPGSKYRKYTGPVAFSQAPSKKAPPGPSMQEWLGELYSPPAVHKPPYAPSLIAPAYMQKSSPYPHEPGGKLVQPYRIPGNVK